MRGNGCAVGRREFLRGWALAAGGLLLAACSPATPVAPLPTAGAPQPAGAPTIAPAPTNPAQPAPTTAPATSVAGATAVIAHYAMLADLDPGQLPNFDAWMALQNILEPLVAVRRQTDGSLAIDSVLAERYDKSADGRVWTFKLRSGVTFHDGTPFNSQAVAFTHERVMNENHPNYDKRFVQLKDALNGVIASVETPDDSTVRFTLQNPPSPYFLNWEGFVRIVSPTAVQKFGKDFGAHVVGTGPFKLDVFDWTGKSMEMSKNASYWQPGQPKISKLIWRVVTEPATRVAQLETGDADIATIVPTDLAARIKSNSKLTLDAANVPNFNMVEFYRTVAPFNDKRLRQAVAQGLDRQSLSDVLYAGYWKPATNNRWPGMPGWEDYSPYPYNAEQAKSLAQQVAAGGVELTLDMPSASSGNPAGPRWGEVIQEQLGKIGIQVKLNVMEAGPFWQLLNQPREGTAHYMTRQVIVGDVINEWLLTWIKPQPYADTPVPGLPELYAQYQKSTDPTKQDVLLKQMWKTIDDEVPYVAVADGSWLTGYRQALTGLAPQGMGEYLSLKNADLRG